MTARACVLLVSILLTTTACNTVEGFGEDVSKAGDAINETAGNVKKKIDE